MLRVEKMENIKQYFNTPDSLVSYINKDKLLRHYFMAGGCSQLVKILYKYYVNKKKKNYKILCIIDRKCAERVSKKYNSDVENIESEDFLNEFYLTGIEHVAMVIEDKVYDGFHNTSYNKEEYEHKCFLKKSFYYKEVEIKDSKDSRNIMNILLAGHKYGGDKISYVINKILNNKKAS